MRYAMARYRSEQRDLAYRVFVTDFCNLYPQGKYRQDRFSDFLTAKTVDNRRGDEIAADVIKRAGLSFG